MKLRAPQVLRFHKFNKEKSPHEYYYTELQLYHPHTINLKTGLHKEKDDIDVCLQTFNSSRINKVKEKIMPFLQSVEEGLERAQELVQNLVGDELNPQKEQDNDECEAEGIQDNPNFLLSDPGNLTENCESESTGLFKKVTLSTDDELEKLTEKLDDDQRLVLSQVQNYSRRLKISRSTPEKIEPPMILEKRGPIRRGLWKGPSSCTS